MKIKAIIVGFICLFVFYYLGIIVEFWMTGLIESQQIDFKAGSNSFIANNIEVFVAISICGALIKFIPPGFITALVAKRRILQHGLVIATVAAIYLLISNLMIEEVHIGMNILFFFVLLNTFLAFSLCLLGSFLFRLKLGDREL